MQIDSLDIARGASSIYAKNPELGIIGSVKRANNQLFPIDAEHGVDNPVAETVATCLVAFKVYGSALVLLAKN